jgi:hypothetical protein
VVATRVIGMAAQVATTSLLALTFSAFFLACVMVSREAAAVRWDAIELKNWRTPMTAEGY